MVEDTSSHRMPSGLIRDGKGQRLWRDLTSKWEFTQAEYKLLETACYTADRIVRERRAIGDQLIVKGSQGQIVAHPLLAQLRADEEHLAKLLARIDMPEPEENESSGTNDGQRSSQMRAVVNSRWHTAYGSG
ncbi:hypothetical protein D2E25_0257 [Bifidobacterium goeldii]|uniref:Terminase n=1 Tax=Bifidobacterium goeldii TaxID=2306975 RepID=A0A430FMM0_9BIFI|nr:hypothetical protein [Bifidobacterium goeldii]RSX53951.1 hypothetical protein D2E25_0257 [Bifidobacterium goeldii]